MINYKIGAKNFETIGNNIGAILKLEFDNQVSEFKNEDCKCVDIYRERTTPINSTETTVVNLSYASSSYDNKNQGNKSAGNLYFIDVYTQSNSGKEEDGDELANLKLQRLMGIIDDILENPIYKTLGFASNARVVSSSMIENIEIMYPKDGAADALASCFGRMTFRVNAIETNGLLNGVAVDQAITTVHISATDKGFKYELV